MTKGKQTYSDIRKWYLKGYTTPQIAEKVKLSTGRVSNILCKVRDELRAKSKDEDIDLLKQTFLEKLYLVADELLQLWEEKKSVCYLYAHEKIQKRIADLIGLDAPKKSEVKNITIPDRLEYEDEEIKDEE